MLYQTIAHVFEKLGGIIDVQSSTDKKLAKTQDRYRHCRTSDEMQYCQYWMLYVWLLPTRLLASRLLVEALAKS